MNTQYPISNTQCRLRRLDQGLTLVEVLISIGIGSLLIAALSLFFTRGIETNRENFQQVLTTEDARIQLERVGDALRNGRSVENEAGWAAAYPGETDWLIDAQDYSISFYTNLDSDQVSERVTYAHLANTLVLTVEDIVDGSHSEIIVSKGILNLEKMVPMFEYFDIAGNSLTQGSAGAGNVYRIGLRLLVDAGANPTPTEVNVETILSPRGRSTGDIHPDLLKPAILHLPSGNPPSEIGVRVTLDAGGAGQTDDNITLPILNGGRLTVFSSGYYTNINWQDITFEGTAPGWYAWIGPILVGQQDGQSFYQTDKMGMDQICDGSDLGILLQAGGCLERTVTYGSFSQSYKPILVYASVGEVYYVRDILFDGP